MIEQKALKESTIRLIIESLSLKEAHKLANKVLKITVKEVKKANLYNVEKNYNDYIYLINELTEEHLNKDDIKWYFSMNPLREWMFCQISNLLITKRMLIIENEGYSRNEAMIKLRKSIPIFGRPDKSLMKSFNLTDKDDNLPPPLQRRIDLYVAKYKESNIMKFLENLDLFSTFNAFIRDEIQSGKLNNIKHCDHLNIEPDIKLFESTIKEHENQLFGIKLYNENISLLYKKDTADWANQHYINIKQSDEDSIKRAKELLHEIINYPDFVEYLRLFQFPQIHGNQILEEMTEKAKILVQTYNELFPNQPREKELNHDEKHILLMTSSSKW